MNLSLGLLINFGAVMFKQGVKRVVNRHTDFSSSRLRVNQGQERGLGREGWGEDTQS